MVIGGSAGGFQALRSLLRRLPADLPAAVLVVLHTGRTRPGAAAEVLGRSSGLPVHYARDGEPLRHGTVLVAPPDFHLIVEGDAVRTVHGPRENGFRPAIDPLFRTAAASGGERVVGVILSGALDDGALGLDVVKRAGGLAVVQSAEEAIIPDLPRAALRGVAVDYELPAEKIADLLIAVCRGDAEPARPGRVSEDPAREGTADLRVPGRLGPASAYTCPECGGALWEVRRGNVNGFRCHVGHAYGESSMIAHQADAIEKALWTALRTLEEAVALRRRMADHATETGLEALARAYLDGAADAAEKAERIRDVLTDAAQAGDDLREGNRA